MDLARRGGNRERFSTLKPNLECFSTAATDRIAEDLVHYIRENKGTLSKKRRTGEFKKLREDEVVAIEGIVRGVFQS